MLDPWLSKSWHLYQSFRSSAVIHSTQWCILPIVPVPSKLAYTFFTKHANTFWSNSHSPPLKCKIGMLNELATKWHQLCNKQLTTVNNRIPPYPMETPWKPHGNSPSHSGMLEKVLSCIWFNEIIYLIKIVNLDGPNDAHFQIGLSQIRVGLEAGEASRLVAEARRGVADLSNRSNSSLYSIEIDRLRLNWIDYYPDPFLRCVCIQKRAPGSNQI